MFQALLVAVFLAASPSCLQLPPEPQPGPKPELLGTFRLTQLENATVTFTVTHGDKWSYKAVKTDDGPRIRLTFRDVTIDATRLEIRLPGTSSDGTPDDTLELIMRLGLTKDGVLTVKGEQVKKPDPKQKRP
jgi:hypothetical protein